ncbi:hypothetical protein KBZ14_00045 [Synechococcus sp. HJ21-Hayes]|uniref:hypothetical protein n=1 Tax=unclassified Synechococcus TaxID=2626047 RepID=UPI0020CEBFD0|nr:MULTISPECIES: hypothetical protein [unclassified Synechococcus]MCP9830549.1 hypothetical protein [Synechococcus sp. JJ3a-Johnson]MCP9851266.1 hypothetical protein [Synechococcus sp. HJ21-Hayes]
MSERLEERNKESGLISPLLSYFSHRWEELFFLLVFALLCFENLAFVSDAEFLSSLHGATAFFAEFEFFVVRRLSYATIPLVVLPLAYLFASRGKPQWSRRYLDILGIYFIARMTTQLIGLNILVFDFTTSRFLLITQLLFFLPYSLLVWGWIYWRLDTSAGRKQRQLFRLDIESENPRPIDYLIASFSSVFSASISGIKGRSARARILILLHGLVIYDAMGLTLSRAVALVQNK